MSESLSPLSCRIEYVSSAQHLSAYDGSVCTVLVIDIDCPESKSEAFLSSLGTCEHRCAPHVILLSSCSAVDPSLAGLFDRGVVDLVVLPTIDAVFRARIERSLGSNYRSSPDTVPESIERESSGGPVEDTTRARLAAIVESSNDAIVGKSLEGIIQTWNTGATKIFGYTADEIVGRSITVLIPPERLSEEGEILARIRRGEKVDHFETVRLRKDGRRIHLSVTVSPIKDSSGKVIGASKTARDITERKETEDKLRRSEERFRALFESMDEGYCVIEPIFDARGVAVDYRYLLANRAFELHTGLTDPIGKTACQMMPTHESIWIQSYARVGVTGETFQKVGRVEDLNRWFEVSAFRVGDENDKHVRPVWSSNARFARR